jgi:ABC-2 type transport system permease protein
MHQVGDEAVAADAAVYRESLIARERWTERLGWLLPPVGAQGLIHRLADTDRLAQLSYQDAVTGFHDRLRRFFYPYLFDDRPFTRGDFDLLPRFSPRALTGSWPGGPMLALVVLAAAALVAGAARLRRL